jgi:hypothetical protein
LLCLLRAAAQPDPVLHQHCTRAGILPVMRGACCCQTISNRSQTDYAGSHTWCGGAGLSLVHKGAQVVAKSVAHITISVCTIYSIQLCPAAACKASSFLQICSSIGSVLQPCRCTSIFTMLRIARCAYRMRPAPASCCMHLTTPTCSAHPCYCTCQPSCLSTLMPLACCFP